MPRNYFFGVPDPPSLPDLPSGDPVLTRPRSPALAFLSAADWALAGKLPEPESPPLLAWRFRPVLVYVSCGCSGGA